MADVMEINDQNFQDEIANSDKPAIVDFWAPWCGPCRMMHPILESLAEEYEGRAVIGRCNVDESPSLAGQFNITAIPTLLIFKDGNQVDMMVGVSPEGVLKERLESYL